ncbi:hypothetical protein BGW38_007125, partial [Lunasporangiospora selenospora]
MSSDLATAPTKYPSPTGQVNIVFNQAVTSLRWIEATTEARHIESLFLLVDDARDTHIRQLLSVFPELSDKNRVVRYANLKLDQQFMLNDGGYLGSDIHGLPRPNFGQLFRVETRFIAIGKTSVKFQHRFWTVPKSQAKRDFNSISASEDNVLEDDEEPERVFASAEGSLVFVKWQTDENGRRFFKSTPGVFQDPSLAAPAAVQFLISDPPQPRSEGSVRPANAFRVPLNLRKSDEDQLGHVTNSRYVALLHDVLTYGLRTGYYSTGKGAFRTGADLHVIPQDSTSGVAVPKGSVYFKRANIYELYVGYERELKVKPGVAVWTWIEQDDRLPESFAVVRFEICATDKDGREQIVSLSRAIIREDVEQQQQP